MTSRIYLPKPGPETTRRECNGGGVNIRSSAALILLKPLCELAAIAALVLAIDAWHPVVEAWLLP